VLFLAAEGCGALQHASCACREACDSLPHVHARAHMMLKQKHVGSEYRSGKAIPNVRADLRLPSKLILRFNVRSSASILSPLKLNQYLRLKLFPHRQAH
jgi:hypothetical protein